MHGEDAAVRPGLGAPTLDVSTTPGLRSCQTMSFSRSALKGDEHARANPSFTMSNRPPETSNEAPAAEFMFQCDRFPLGPEAQRWWSQTGSNRRPHACKARALPTELWPRSEPAAAGALSSRRRPGRSQTPKPGKWWAQADSNCRPHAYQACALTS